MKRSQLKRGTKGLKRTGFKRGTKGLRKSELKRGTARLRNRSPKKAEDDAKYFRNKKTYQAANPDCQMPGCHLSLERGDVIDLHHKAGRNGPLLYCMRYFSSLCREHHDFVGENKTWSRANGWIIDVSSDEIRRMRAEEL